MNIKEISKPVTAKSLNESLAKKFGQKIKLETFTLEQLEDARNRIRTKLSQVETNESFDSVYKNESYQKSKLFLDVLNAEISERSDIAEKKGSKPDYLDFDGDGNKKEPMKKALKDKKKKPVGEAVVTEGEEDKAELVMAAKDMVDKVTAWMEDTAQMQTESMLELADAIRDEMGSQVAEQFTQSVKPALEAMYTAMESTRATLTQGVGQLTGEAAPEMMGADSQLPMDPAMEPPVGDEMPADEFGAAAPAAGGDEEAGRAKRESKAATGEKIVESLPTSSAEYQAIKKKYEDAKRTGDRATVLLLGQLLKDLYGEDDPEAGAAGGNTAQPTANTRSQQQGLNPNAGGMGLRQGGGQGMTAPESVAYSKKKVAEQSKKIGAILSKKKP